MTDNELLDVIRAAAYEDGGKKKLPCVKVFALARQHPVSLKDIGRLCNEHDIRIAKCQLGCFE